MNDAKRIVGKLAGAPVSQIDHVAVAVRDADAANAYYRESLGLALLHDERLNAVGTRLTYFDAGNTMLQLVQPIGEGPVADFLATHGEGLHHICFAVPEIGEALNALPGEQGAEVFQGGYGRRACFLVNRPNGTLFELIESEPQG